MNSISLHELNGLVQKALQITMPDTFWVRAEISELRVAVNGHCYMELVEHDEQSGTITAKARANCWRNTYAFLRPKFEKESGQRLEAGIRVLVEVQVSFHPQYGYALVVTDIDPTFTLGDAARRRQEIVNQLLEDGVFDMNREISLPTPLRRIAIISSETAAGYGDFCNQLQQSGLPFTLRLFPAIMQGEQVEGSIISALNEIAEQQEAWDAVVIIRGGGAVTDLNGFESYALAANVAQFPIPVITGIGHERDETVIDLVAHTRLKTPTAVAAFLIEQWQGELDHVSLLEQRLNNIVKQRIAEENVLLSAFSTRLTSATYQAFGRNKIILSKLEQQLSTATYNLFRLQQHRLQIIEKSLALASPVHILKQGYSITRLNGKAIHSLQSLKQGDKIVTTLADGEIHSIIQ